jgi:serine/threonine protein kinase
VSHKLQKDEEQVTKYRSEFKKEGRTESYYLMSILFDLYERINDSIQLLVKYKLVHYDLKENNILIESIQQLPYIIDFGLSIDVSRLLSHPWNEKEERNTTIDSNIVYGSKSSSIFKHNYLWRQHFYVHAPDYHLWPMEVHIITYLINENDTLTEEDLRKISYEYVSYNKALTYMSPKFKEDIYNTTVATYIRFVHQPREMVLNELLKYWDKWDVFAINQMFLKIMFQLIFSIRKYTPTPSAAATSAAATSAAADATSASNYSHEERRQQMFDPDLTKKDIRFKTQYKLKLKNKYNNRKILNTIQVMLRNIHPNPDKRMTPQETKEFFVSIFYDC